MPFMRRLAGAALLLAAYAPTHRLLDVERTGPAGASVQAAAETAWILGLSGSLIVVVFAWLLARMVPFHAERPDPLERLAELLSRPAPLPFALALGCVVAAAASVVSLTVHGAGPTSVDEMAQLYHASALAGGKLAVPLHGGPASWMAQNGIATGLGWASIYPPMHTLLLAVGLAAGAAWLVGPVLLGIATAAFGWSAEALLGTGTGRLAGLLLAVSPFWLLLGATPANHVAAACGLSLVLVCALRARDGGIGWAVATGAAVGLAVSARPWTGLLVSAAMVALLWWRSGAPARRFAALAAGGAPFAVLLLWWNATLFGSPVRLGYTAAFGPAHGLGFHDDPWGNRYGVAEAIGYTGADLLLLGVRLLEGPLPALALIGLALVALPVRKGTRVFAAWAGAGVVAAFFYWHHGIHFGPRMFYETVPGWMALVAVSVAALLRPDGYTPSSTTARFLRFTALVTVVGGLALTPTAFRSVAAADRDASGSAAEILASAGAAGPALVFLHGSWSSRVAARLSAAGMRRDSIETALRRNDICAVDRYARWRWGNVGAAAPALDFTPRPGSPSTLVIRELSPGNRVRVDPRSSVDAACLREARSDRFGSLELEFHAWRFPPIDGADVVVARDMGPAGNLPALDAFRRTAYVLVDGDTPVLVTYAEGMELLWGGAAGEAGRQE